MATVEIFEIEQMPAAKPQQGIDSSVIWLHGLGADGHDFAPLVESLDFPHTRFILPHAPVRPVTLNGGYAMRAWYDILGLKRESAEDFAGIAEMQSMLNALIEREIASGIAPSRIVLAGFSQGGAMALHTALRYPQRLAGVLALSTYLPLSSHLAQEAHPANAHMPIFMAHGRWDDVIELSVAQGAYAQLIAAHYAVEWHEYAMPHSVCDAEIADLEAFLHKVLDA